MMITLRASFVVALVGLSFGPAPQDDEIILTRKSHHLGDDRTPGWKDTTPDPEGRELRLTFEAKKNDIEHVLEITQRHINQRWTVAINKKPIGTLAFYIDRRQTTMMIEPGVLVDGTNTLTITSPKNTDDIVVGPARIITRPMRDWKRFGKVTVTVTDGDTGKPIPARVSLYAADGGLPLYYGASPGTAVRSGIFYTLGDGASFEIPEGTYTVHATRGMEWSLGKARIDVTYQGETAAALEISRVVDTAGFVAADTHIHTLTYSGHGDASIEERMVTLAGEGIELAIATDHNHHTDYAPVQRKMKLNEHFTPVTGNEVTTDNGHFNSFPMPPKGKRPDHTQKNWVKLIDDIRSKGASVIILNHPHWPELEKRSPLGVFGFDPRTGDRKGPRFTFDAIEVVNSNTTEPKPLLLFKDWFALLNRGERITAVGSSDSHSVKAIVGQGRTYVRSSATRPGSINVDEACEAFRRGDVSVSLGIFADITVYGSVRMGQQTPVKGQVEASLRIAAPEWITPKRALLYMNGTLIEEKPVPVSPGKATDITLEFSVAPPSHDAHLVCIVLGDDPQVRGWKTINGYTLAATNPVYLDVDGDGTYRCARESARRLLKSKPDLKMTLKKVDEAVAHQILSLLHETSPESLKGLDVYPDVIKQLGKHEGHRH